MTILVYLSGCQSENDKRLNFALKLASENRHELEEVLEHYKNDPLKLKAARFLIENMPGHAGYDSTDLKQWHKTYEQLHDISAKHNWERSGLWARETNAFWNEHKTNIHFPLMHTDISTLKADWLIREIDLAFKAWQENGFTKNASFDDFCTYILPYRFQNGVCPDNARHIFYQRHAGHYSDTTKSFQEITDSLNYAYRFLQFNFFAASSVPIYSVGTFEYLKRGLCNHMTWYNALLLSALGMAVAIDFVPEWGNRNESHSWNALIINGNSYPFEPFWDNDRWKYKKIYNNENFDLIWGKFRLPKVFRNTYEFHLEGPIADKQVSSTDIPSLFRNLRIKDVSKQYFETSDVSINLTENIPDNARYCYLCVYSTKGWVPVQWGKIEKNRQVVFKNMGRDIVYLPAFYSNGIITPAAPVFILEQNGSIKKQIATNKKAEITIRTPKSYLYKNLIEDGKKMLVGGKLVGCENPTDTKKISEELYTLTDSMDMWSNNIKLLCRKPYQYIKLLPACDTIALCEITFFAQAHNELIRIPDVKVSANIKGIKEGETLSMFTDHLSATGFKGIIANEKKKEIIFDLGKPYLIKEISYIPYTEHCVSDLLNFELYYWNNKWIHAGTQQGTNNVITFKQVPQGTIYRVIAPKIEERIFTYDDGMINWF